MDGLASMSMSFDMEMDRSDSDLGNHQRAAWPLAAWIERKMQWLSFKNDTPLPFIGRGTPTC